MLKKYLLYELNQLGEDSSFWNELYYFVHKQKSNKISLDWNIVKELGCNLPKEDEEANE